MVVYDHPMSIRELADSLGVSKTTIRKRMTPEFREQYTETNENHVLIVSADGCNRIAETVQSARKPPETSAPKFAETPESDSETPGIENITIPLSVWQALQEQLSVKDRQIEALQAALLAAQALHAGKQLPLLDEAPSEAVPPRKGFWSWFKR